MSQLHSDLAAVLRQQGDLAAAASCYRRSIALAADAETFHRLGLTLFEQEQWGAAAECYQRAIALWESGIESRKSARLAMAYSNLGCALVQQGEVMEAIDRFRHGLHLAPDWATLHLNLGQAIAQLDQDAEAIASFERAIELEPNAAVAHLHLAQLWQRQDCWPEAIAHWQRVVELAPDASAWGELAIAQMQQGDWRQTIESLRSALHLQPEFAEAFCQRANRLSSDAWSELQRSTAQFLESLRSSQSDSLQLLAETYLHRANLLWQYGGEMQIQQADRDFAEAQRIAKAENLRLSLPARSIDRSTLR